MWEASRLHWLFTVTCCQLACLDVQIEAISDSYDETVFAHAAAVCATLALNAVQLHLTPEQLCISHL